MIKLSKTNTILVVFLLFLTLYVSRNTLNDFDLAISWYVQSMQSDLLDLFMQLVSWPGNWYSVPFVTLSFAFILSKLKLAIHSTKFIWTTIIATAIVSGLKYLISRPRPNLDLVDFVTYGHIDHSYPSGHVTIFTVIFGYLLLLSVRYPTRMPLWIRLFSLTMILTIGLSRIYLGAHWFTDVIGGYLLGGLILIISFRHSTGTTKLD